MKPILHHFGSAAVALLAMTPAATADSGDAENLFVAKVRPLLEEKCAGCHGDRGKKIKGEFDMRTRDGLLKGGESGEAGLVPGDPDASPMFVAVTWKDPLMEMPPKENDRLDERQIADLRRWIAAGAPWVDEEEGEGPALTGPLGSLSEPDEDGLVRVRVSGAESRTWRERGYDPKNLWAFQPVPDVVPPEDGHPIDAFIDAALEEKNLEPAPLAGDAELARRVSFGLTGLPPSEAQLATPYTELVDQLLATPAYGERFAQHWLDVTRYADSNGFSRDDMRPEAHKYRSYVIDSFNQDKPYDRFVREQVAGDELGLAGQEALAFLWMGPWEITAMTSAAVARQMWLDDAVNSIGVTFLGQELRCAKCHDHKFDPIPTRDYYSMQAILGSTKHHVKNGTFKIQPQKPQVVSVLKGGALDSPAEEAPPGLLSAIALTDGFQVPATPQGRRSALANWIASPENPLTARVIVNRVWQWHFGRGLVATSNGFGAMGAKPSHPVLLDWLAGWFIENGWSIKELNRLILTSEAYRRSTKHPELAKVRTIDPDGVLLASFRPRRLSAEEVRDSMLAVSGELQHRVGGPGFRAEINWEVAFQPRLAMGKLQKPWEPDAKKADRHRRSLYAMRVRNLGHPVMEVLNRPPSELSCEKRDETTVVTQAFSLFHGEFSNARALALAHRVAQDDSKDLAQQVRGVYARVLAREPGSEELRVAVAHVEDMRRHHAAHPPKPRPLPTEVTLSTVIEKTGEPNFTSFQLEGLKNYERDLQPWQVDANTRALAELCLVLLNSSEFLHVY